MLAILAAAVLAAAPFQTERQIVTIRQDAIACAASNDYLPWCAGSGVAPRAFSVAEVTAIQAQAFAKFTPDVDADPTRWVTHQADVASGHPWSGQCNEAVFTTLDLMARAGLDRDLIWRAVVNLGTGLKPDHMVGIVWAEGQFWIVGDISTASRKPYPLVEARWRAVMISHASDGPIWRHVSLKRGALGRLPQDSVRRGDEPLGRPKGR